MDILSRLYDTFGMTKDQRMMSGSGYISGPNGLQFALSDPSRVTLFDDFLGKTLSGVWSTTKGSDGGTALAAINAAVDGTARMTTGAGSTITMAVNGTRIDGGALNWYGNQGGMDVQFRVKASAVSQLAIFVGWSNESGTLAMPAQGSGTGNGITTNDNDCLGFLYDSAMTTKDWWLVGSAATVDPTPQDTGSGPTLGVYDVLRVEVSKGGNVAYFYRNGVQVGVGMPAPVTLSVGLTPVIAAFSRSAASVNIDIDYGYATQQR